MDPFRLLVTSRGLCFREDRAAAPKLAAANGRAKAAETPAIELTVDFHDHKLCPFLLIVILI